MTKLSVAILIGTFVGLSAHSQTPEAGKIRIKTDPKDCSVSLLDSVSADWKKKGKWKEAELEPGQYTASIRAKDATLEFRFDIIEKATIEASVDFDFPAVFLKAAGSKEVSQVPCIIRADSGTVMEPPLLIHEEPAEFPRSASAQGVEGDVTLKILVGKSGEVKEASVRYTSGHKILDESAIRAALRFKFRPGTLNGKATACWVSKKFTFYYSQ